MVDVKTQYDTYPYPHRDPKDENNRLITGSPSLPFEIDHFVFAGKRDWSEPLKVLVAGGGTGDGLIQLATLMAQAGKPYEITYLDLSETARAIAEERAKVRNLTDISFQTGSLLDAADYGTFDYIDCCGVLHHLPEPDLGFKALSNALAPDGGLGIMVYAPYGRGGVYPLQEAFGTLFQDATAQDRLSAAKSVLENLPKGHPFKLNPHLVDHEQSDAGFYDLLLHSQDRPYSVGELSEAMSRAGLRITGLVPPGLYDLKRLLPKGVDLPDSLSSIEAMEIAEKLRGTLKTHIAYGVHQSSEAGCAKPGPNAVPVLKGVSGPQLAQVVLKSGQVKMNLGQETIVETLPKSAASVLQGIDGKTPVGTLLARAKVDLLQGNILWAQIDRALTDWGMMYYSRVLL